MRLCSVDGCSSLVYIDGRCKECQAEFRHANYLKNKEYNNAVSKKWREDNPERVKELKKIWAETEKGKEYYNNKSKKYRISNSEQTRLSVKKYSKANRDVCNAKKARYRAGKKAATVSWANKESIDSIYAMSSFLTFATFGNGYHVDHIVPLQNGKVCGLHVENNLQILPARTNQAKGNSFNF